MIAKNVTAPLYTIFAYSDTVAQQVRLTVSITDEGEDESPHGDDLAEGILALVEALPNTDHVLGSKTSVSESTFPPA